MIPLSPPPLPSVSFPLPSLSLPQLLNSVNGYSMHLAMVNCMVTFILMNPGADEATDYFLQNTDICLTGHQSVELSRIILADGIDGVSCRNYATSQMLIYVLQEHQTLNIPLFPTALVELSQTILADGVKEEEDVGIPMGRVPKGHFTYVPFPAGSRDNKTIPTGCPCKVMHTIGWLLLQMLLLGGNWTGLPGGSYSKAGLGTGATIPTAKPTIATPGVHPQQQLAINVSIDFVSSPMQLKKLVKACHDSYKYVLVLDTLSVGRLVTSGGIPHLSCDAVQRTDVISSEVLSHGKPVSWAVH
ncbi:hypothetical protein M422DRAFT_56398 [Sphaerobolus stellatus SS14]|uniref:Uncharacterized protein n=1 Tax=Sphaerobolus stellatus (strain SS14) TaxID=990650 RepID=A0A0C9UGB5_SPHS4|nr:hypothetical protein M422DRAFT_56398 [Sphaerobolus stellatus SS14]